MKYYYLLNGKIMLANEKMPELRIVQHKDYNQKFEDSKFKMFYDKWFNALQPCEISESELCLILSNVTKLDYDNPIEVTDIVRLEEINTITKSGTITDYQLFFKYPKQVGETEAVGYVAILHGRIISGVYKSYDRLKEDYPSTEHCKLTNFRNI